MHEKWGCTIPEVPAMARWFAFIVAHKMLFYSGGVCSCRPRPGTEPRGLCPQDNVQKLRGRRAVCFSNWISNLFNCFNMYRMIPFSIWVSINGVSFFPKKQWFHQDFTSWVKLGSVVRKPWVQNGWEPMMSSASVKSVPRGFRTPDLFGVDETFCHWTIRTSWSCVKW